jgi:hypothetical protein
LVIDTVRETLPNITIDLRAGIGSGRYVSFTAEDPAHTMTYHVAGVALASPPQNIAVGFLASPTKPLSTTERQELVDALGSISLSSPKTETSTPIVAMPRLTATDQQPVICSYAGSAADALVKAREILARADVNDKAQLRRTAAQLTTLAHDFGQITVPSGAIDLQAWTTGAIAAASQMLDAFVAGRDGQAEAGLHLTLLKSATDEVARIRRERCSAP